MPYVTLRCATCDNTDCAMARAYVPHGSQEGCTRGMTEEQAECLYHCIEEVLPFLHLRPVSDVTRAQFAQIDDCLASAYGAPMGRRIAADGKAAD